MPGDSNPKASAGGKPASEAYPMTAVSQPHNHDVLCGRGGGTNNHIGNNHWRTLVSANKRLYLSLPKRQKMLVAQSIVRAVRSQNPPGRFLQKEKNNLWADIGDQKAQDKTSQALREGAPDIRNEMKNEAARQRELASMAAMAGLTGIVPQVSTSGGDVVVPAPAQKPAAAPVSAAAPSGTAAAHQQRGAYPVVNAPAAAGMHQRPQMAAPMGHPQPIPFPPQPQQPGWPQQMQAGGYPPVVGWMPPQMVAMASQQQQQQQQSGPLAVPSSSSPSAAVSQPASASPVPPQSDAAGDPPKAVSAGQAAMAAAAQQRELKRRLSSSSTASDQKPPLGVDGADGAAATMPPPPAPAPADDLLRSEILPTPKMYGEKGDAVGDSVPPPDGYGNVVQMQQQQEQPAPPPKLQAKSSLGRRMLPPNARIRFEGDDNGDCVDLIRPAGFPPSGGAQPGSLLDDDDDDDDVGGAGGRLLSGGSSAPGGPGPEQWHNVKAMIERTSRQSSETNSSVSGKGSAGGGQDAGRGQDAGGGQDASGGQSDDDDDDAAAEGNNSSGGPAMPNFERDISMMSNMTGMTGLSFIDPFDDLHLPPQKGQGGVLQSVGDGLLRGISGVSVGDIGMTDLDRGVSAAMSEMSLSRGPSLTTADFLGPGAVGSKFGGGVGGGGYDHGSFEAQTAVALGDALRSMPPPVAMAPAGSASDGGLYGTETPGQQQHGNPGRGVDDNDGVDGLDEREQLEITLLNRGQSLAVQPFSPDL